MTSVSLAAITCALLVHSVTALSCVLPPVDESLVGKEFIQFPGSGCYGRPSGVKTKEIIFTRYGGLRYTQNNPRERCATVILFPYGGNRAIRVKKCGRVRFINARRNKRYANIISLAIKGVKYMRDERCGGRDEVPRFFDLLEFQQFLANQAISNAAISHLYGLAYYKGICIRAGTVDKSKK